VNRACRTCQVVDLINLDIERKGNIVPLNLEVGIAAQVSHIALRSGKKIVDAQHLVTGSDQSIAQMRPEKARSARNQYS
jgi:hypothetical protein